MCYCTAHYVCGCGCVTVQLIMYADVDALLNSLLRIL